MKLGEALNAYQKRHNLSRAQIGKELKVSPYTISTWKKGKHRPRGKALVRLVKAGIVWDDDEAKEQLRSLALNKKFEEQDNKNKLPRAYNRRVVVANALHTQISNMLDEYVNQMAQPNTWDGFSELKTHFIKELVYVCEQGRNK